MKLRLCLLSFVVLAGLAGPLAAVDIVTETWRSPWGAPAAVAVNPTDSSVWAALGSTVVHLSADGTMLWRGTDFWSPVCVAVNAADGSCWVADSSRNQVVHLSAAGAEVWRGGGFVAPGAISVNPADGSVWVGQSGPVTPGAGGEPEVIHLAADGTVLWRSNAYYPFPLAVSPADGACWVMEDNTARLVRLSPIGEETATTANPFSGWQIGTGLADGSVWVSDTERQQVVHLSASAEEIGHIDVTGPGDVAVSPTDGSLWVLVPTPPSPTTLYGAHDVAHLAADGTELWRQGGFGDPRWATVPLAPDPADGSVWVADWPHGSLVHLDAGGAESFRGRRFDDPVAVTADSVNHTAWVADTGRSQVVHLDTGGREMNTINDCWPITVAVSPTDGSVWEMDGVARAVIHYRRDGTELWRQPAPSTGPGSVIAINPNDGSGWVAFFDLLVHYSAWGNELWRGTGFWGISSLAIDRADGSCWVTFGASGIGQYIAHLAADGHEIWRGPDGMFQLPYAVGVDPRDRSVRVAEYTLGAVTSLDRQGEVLWSTEVGSVPYSVAVDPRDGACWVATYGSGSGVVLLSAAGVVLWRGNGFSSPQSVSVDAGDGACWVADTCDSQVVRLERFQFTDVPFTNWASDAIYECVAAGIVSGYGSGGYQPSLPVTRDQMAVYLARALAGGDENLPTGPATPTFTDVDEEHWVYKYVEYCADQGLVEGYWNDTYRPDELVSRAQMAVYIARAIADPPGEEGLAAYQGPSTATFTDVPSDHWAWRYVEYAAAHGVVQGYYANIYRPEAPVSRDQMAAYVARAFLQ